MRVPGVPKPAARRTDLAACARGRWTGTLILNLPNLQWRKHWVTPLLAARDVRSSARGSEAQVAHMTATSVLITLTVGAALLALQRPSEFVLATQNGRGGPSSPALRIEATITDTRYCRSGDDETATMFADLELIATNTGTEPLVITVHQPHLTRVVVARDERALAKGDVISDADLHYVTPGSEPKRLQTSDFVTIQKSGDFRFPDRLSLPVLFARQGFSVRGFPGNGIWVVRPVVSLWGYGDKITEDWTRHFRDVGRLWIDAVHIEHVRVTIRADAPLRDCSR